MSGCWSDPEAFLTTCKGRFGPTSEEVERLLGRGVMMTADEIKKVGSATEAGSTKAGVIGQRRYELSFQIARDIAVQSGRETAFQLIGTKGAEAVTRASVRGAEADGRDSQPVINAWDSYSATKGGNPADRESASYALDAALAGLIGDTVNRWVLAAGVGIQRAALAVLIWDVAERERKFKPKYRDWLVHQCRALELGPEYLPWLR
jgi:hypothetical protein